MRKSLKGALLSGLLLPGLGQLWLKHPLRGIAFIVAVTAALAVIVSKVAGQAWTILEKAESEGGAVDLVAIVNSAHVTSYEDALMKWAAMALLACWMVSIIDAYRLGDKRDREDRRKPLNGGAP